MQWQTNVFPGWFWKWSIQILDETTDQLMHKKLCRSLSNVYHQRCQLRDAPDHDWLDYLCDLKGLYTILGTTEGSECIQTLDVALSALINRKALIPAAAWWVPLMSIIQDRVLVTSKSEMIWKHPRKFCLNCYRLWWLHFLSIWSLTYPWHDAIDFNMNNAMFAFQFPDGDKDIPFGYQVIEIYIGSSITVDELLTQDNLVGCRMTWTVSFIDYEICLCCITWKCTHCIHFYSLEWLECLGLNYPKRPVDCS